MIEAHKWIQITDLAINDASILFTYKDYRDRDLSIELRYDQPITEALTAFRVDSIHRLVNYLGIAQCLYFFDYDYYDEIIAYYALDELETTFFEQLLLDSMAEFRYVNHLDIHQKTTVRGTHTPPEEDRNTEAPELHGAIVLNGGGKDGAVAAETIHASGQALTWFTLHKEGVREKIITASGYLDQITGERISAQPPERGSLRGHKPLNAALGLHAVLTALVKKKRYAVAGNEYSANDPNLTVSGFAINHQYTKSYQFERDFAALIDRLDLGVHYFSVLRPLYELQILQIFKDFPQYHQIFISCNKGVRKGFWCLACDKCAFLVLALSAIRPEIVESIWGDRNVITKETLRPLLIRLVSDDSQKPFDCVGTLEECQLALGMIAKNTSFWESLPVSFRSEMQAYIPDTVDELEKRIMGNYQRAEHIPSELRDDVFDFFNQHLGL